MSGNESTKRAHEVYERLEQLNRSPIVAAAGEFRQAGLRTEVGACYFHAGQRDFRTIEMVASSTIERPAYHLTTSWHVAMAPGKSDLLVVVTGTGEPHDEHDAVGGFRPLANIEAQDLLPMMRQPYTGISLLDAPRILGHCLEDALKPKGLNSRNYKALKRALSSAYQAIQPAAPSHSADTRPRPHFKIAIPLLISPRDLFEASFGSQGVESDDSCFMGISIGDESGRINQPVVDIINPEFLATYAKMASEAAEKLPNLIDQHLLGSPIEVADSTARAQESLVLGTTAGRQYQLDAWERFRNL